MPTFEYTARDADGREMTGTIQGDSEAAVARTLDERALFPVRIDAHTAGRGGRPGRGGRIRLRSLAVVYSQLSDLLAAGVPMLRSLEILSRSAVNASLAQVIEQVSERVSAGETLADAMGNHPKVFSDLHVAMVRAGEHAGFLEEVLTNMAGFIERQDELRSKVRGAMIYPMVLATFAVIAVSALLIFLVPKFQEFLTGPLPLPSRMLFALSDAMRSYSPLILGSLVAAVLLIRAWARSEGGRRLWSNWQLNIPLAGRAIRMVAITRFCRVLGTMLHNGVPIIQAMTISKDAVGNEMIAAAVADATENVRAGEPLAEPLRRSGLFPIEIIEMIAVGEESNQLEKVLLTMADTVERRTNRQVDAAVRLIEPLMLMIMAGAIGFIAMGLLYPIFTMARTMR